MARDGITVCEHQKRLAGTLIICFLVVASGCVGAIPSLNTGTSESVTNVSIGLGHGLPTDPGPDGEGVDSPPIVETNSSHIIVTGEIPGVGDLSCYDATGSVSTKSNSTLKLTVKSIKTSPPSGCNQTGGAFYPYQVVIASEEPHREQLYIQHRFKGKKTNNWTVAIADREQAMS